MQTASIFFPVPNSSLKWSHYAEIGSYVMIFFISIKLFLYQPDFGCFLAKMGVLGHFEAKKCTNWLDFLPVPNFKYKTALQFKN